MLTTTTTTTTPNMTSATNTTATATTTITTACKDHTHMGMDFYYWLETRAFQALETSQLGCVSWDVS
jgi:hypothetical protein